MSWTIGLGLAKLACVLPPLTGGHAESRLEGRREQAQVTVTNRESYINHPITSGTQQLSGLEQAQFDLPGLNRSAKVFPKQPVEVPNAAAAAKRELAGGLMEHRGVGHASHEFLESVAGKRAGRARQPMWLE